MSPDRERGRIGQHAAGGAERVDVQFARRFDRRLGAAGRKKQPVERPRQLAQQRIRAAPAVDVVDSVQRRLHAAGRNTERLQEQRADAECDRADHEQQVEQSADGLVAVRRRRLAEPRCEFVIPPAALRRRNGFHVSEQRIELPFRLGAEQVVVVVAAEPGFRF